MSVDVVREAGVVTVTLNRPEKRNALTDEMWTELERVFTAVAGRAEDRVVVLRGSGSTFCSGSDVTQFLSRPEPFVERVRLMNRALSALRELSVPTVAQVAGPAVGAGANLALLCDFVLAGRSAHFAEMFIRRGLSVDSGGSWLLPRLVGDRKARELLLLGEPVDAGTAVSIGLINQVHDDDELAAAVHALALRLGALAPPATAGTKRLLGQAGSTSFAEALEHEAENQAAVVGSPAALAAISSFAGRPRR